MLQTGAFVLVVILPTKNLQGPGLAFYSDKAAVYSPKAHNSSYKRLEIIKCFRKVIRILNH